jgi:post-segregation antitoxin (ccd killing protein)
MAGLQADVKVFLDPTRDGIAQITETLGHYQNLTGIDIISHGNVAQVQLGNSFLSANSLQQYTHELKQWEASLTPDADILFYGCNIAAGDLGQAFVKEISTLTGGDVAASTDLTGNSALGGNWTLEYATGTIETQTSFTDSQINSYQGLLASVFTTETPAQFKTDGTGSAGDYELGMEFRSGKSGQISAIRYYKAPSETGTHTGRIWSSTGTLLASVTFTNETASGWQQQTLATPLNIQANTTYVVSVNSNTYYAFTSNGLGTTLTNGDLSAVADGSNGVYDVTPGSFPAQSYQNSNYFRDIVFAPTAPNPNNKPGTVSIGGTATQNQTLTANVADADGLTGVTINYQWQQSSNGTTWTNITGATSQTLTLAQAQVNQQVRVTATYTDALGSSENPLSTATSAIGNVNDPGTVAISGVTAQGNTLTANIADPDGLTGVSITYTWQQSSNGTTWQNITGATNQTLTLDSSLIGQQVRVNATYTDALGGSENILSLASSPISALLESIFASTTTPSQPNFTDGPGVDYELGMKFTSAKAGQIQAIRYYKSPSETGTHVGRIWSSTGTLLASVTFTNETASGWQQQALSTPVTIPANTTYVVSVNTNGYYADTPNGFATAITNGDLTAPVRAGVYNETISAFPTQVYQNENYFRDVVFAPTVSNPNNKPGTVSIGGTATQNQTLTANVADADGLTGVTINYQWQQSSNGTTWTNITGATSQTLTLAQAQVNQQVRVTATYTDALGSSENPLSTATSAVVNVNDLGTVILKGSATIGYTLDETVFDNDGLTGVAINYQWQQFFNSIWTNIAGSIAKSLTLTTALLGQQVRVLASYIDNLGSSENVASAGVTVAAQNAIVVENEKTGTTAWQISNLASNNEIAGYGDATSINKGQALNLKISLAQSGQYSIDVYRLGYYGGTGGRLITSVTGLNGVVQASPTITNASTKLVEWNWNTSYTLQTGSDWTTGLYLAKLTDIRTGKQTYVQFVLRDDNRPADIGFQDSVSTTEAYNNYGGYSTYDANSSGGQRAYQVSFDRPLAAANLGLTNTDGFNTNNMLAWEYNMVRWQESQGYDVSYFTNIDTSINPLQLYSQNVFQVTGHDEYWSMDMMNNVTNARDKGINLAFFSANTAYWQVRFEPSSNGQANRVMTVYKDTSGIGTSGDPLDPIAQTDPSAATTLFRSPQVNRPENALMGVGYLSDTSNVYGGYDFVVSNASDPYYANTGLKNGDKLRGLVGYEWDGLLNNGFAPPGLVVLSQSPVQANTVLPPLPSGTNPNISNAVRYTAASGAKVFSTGSVQWVWGLDSDNVIDPRVDIRAWQITVNVLKDMGAKPKTPSSGIVV